MLTNAQEFNSIGGGYGGFAAPALAGGFGGFGGGFGGIAPIGLIGLNNLFDRDGRGHDKGCNDGPEHPLAILAAISNAKDTTVAEGRALGAAICDSEKTTLQQFYAQAIQAERNTAQLSAQAQAFALANVSQLNELQAAGVAQTAAILARINEAETQSLRDQLFETRRGRDRADLDISIQNTNTNVNAQFQAQAQAQLQAQLDEHKRRWDSRENEINIVNTNTNINAQAQAQAQAQSLRDLDRDHRWNQRFDTLLSQTNKSNQDIVNLGTMVASGVQTPTSTNVNSKQS